MFLFYQAIARTLLELNRFDRLIRVDTFNIERSISRSSFLDQMSSDSELSAAAEGGQIITSSSSNGSIEEVGEESAEEENKDFGF